MTERLVNEKILSQITGLIHVGANVGQEIAYYAKYDLNVLWFEPNIVAFRELVKNITPYPKQLAAPQLLTDRDHSEYVFNVSSGKGQCSSIFNLAEHSKYYPDIQYVRQIKIKSWKLDTFLETASIDPNLFQFMVLDTQMADLLVLRGAIGTLKHLKYVEVETSSLELYKGGCVESEVVEFMKSQNYIVKEKVIATNINNHILFENTCQLS